MKKLYLVFMVFIFVVCCSAADKSVASKSRVLPEKTEFLLTNLYQEAKITIGFEGDRVYGFSGVNRYIGSYEIKDGKINFTGMASTMMAGPEDAMKMESEYLQILSQGGKFDYNGSILHIGDLVFKLEK